MKTRDYFVSYTAFGDEGSVLGRCVITRSNPIVGYNDISSIEAAIVESNKSQGGKIKKVLVTNWRPMELPDAIEVTEGAKNGNDGTDPQ